MDDVAPATTSSRDGAGGDVLAAIKEMRNKLIEKLAEVQDGLVIVNKRVDDIESARSSSRRNISLQDQQVEETTRTSNDHAVQALATNDFADASARAHDNLGNSMLPPMPPPTIHNDDMGRRADARYRGSYGLGEDLLADDRRYSNRRAYAQPPDLSSTRDSQRRAYKQGQDTLGLGLGPRSRDNRDPRRNNWDADDVSFDERAFARESAPHLGHMASGTPLMIKPPTPTPTTIGFFKPDEDASEAVKDNVFARVGPWWRRVLTVVNSVQGPYEPAHRAAVLQCLPLCLQGHALSWYNAAGHDLQFQLQNSLDAWEQSIVMDFRASVQERQARANSITWDLEHESARNYVWRKLEALRDYLPESTTSDLKLMLVKVREGMNNYLAANVSACYAPNPSFRKFWEEIDACDRALKDKRALEKRRPTPTTKAPGASLSPPSSGTRSPFSSTSAASSRTSQSSRESDGGKSLRHSYKPENVKYDRATSPPTRTYRRQDGTVLRLTRPCTKCGKDHFNFEHDFLVSSTNVVDADDNWVVEDISAAEEGSGTQQEADVYACDDTTTYASGTVSPSDLFGDNWAEYTSVAMHAANDQGQDFP